jgi:hypothetical protein
VCLSMGQSKSLLIILWIHFLTLKQGAGSTTVWRWSWDL